MELICASFEALVTKFASCQLYNLYYYVIIPFPNHFWLFSSYKSTKSCQIGPCPRNNIWLGPNYEIINPKIDLEPHLEDAWRIFLCWLFGFDFLHKSTMHAPITYMIKHLSPQIIPLKIPVTFLMKNCIFCEMTKIPFWSPKTLILAQNAFYLKDDSKTLKWL